MGKFIYILFIIGWVIHNLYKAANKNKPAGPSKQGKSKMDELKELVEKTLGGDYQPAEKTAVPTVDYNTTEKRKWEITGKFSNDVKEKNKKQQQKFKTAASETFEPLTVNEGHKPKTEEINSGTEINEPIEKTNWKDFDITQAVLYSEILKRPAWLN